MMMGESSGFPRRWDRRTVRLALLVALGVVLLLVSSWPVRRPAPAVPPVSSQAEPGTVHELLLYQQALSRELESILSLVQGAGLVRVQVTLAESPQNQLATNSATTTRQTEEGGGGGTHRQVQESTQDHRPVMTRSSSGLEAPVVTGVHAPAIKGVLVVAEGGANSRVRAELTRAVSTLLSLPTNRVKVLPMKAGD
ncbi:MAG: hypothetical protein AB1445_06035 [Bacillota bacterium]